MSRRMLSEAGVLAALDRERELWAGNADVQTVLDDLATIFAAVADDI